MTTTDRTVPHRMCIGCRRSLPQTQLVRTSLGRHGAAVSRTAPGRGAWLCSTSCFDTAMKRRAFERAWKQQVSADALSALRIDFERVITNMTELSADGSRSAHPTQTKG